MSAAAAGAPPLARTRSARHTQRPPHRLGHPPPKHTALLNTDPAERTCSQHTLTIASLCPLASPCPPVLSALCSHASTSPASPLPSPPPAVLPGSAPPSSLPTPALLCVAFGPSLAFHESFPFSVLSVQLFLPPPNHTHTHTHTLPAAPPGHLPSMPRAAPRGAAPHFLCLPGVNLPWVKSRDTSKHIA